MPHAHHIHDDYRFTNDWFGGAHFATGESVDIPAIWKTLFARHKPMTFLEVGCFEGNASCFIIDQRAAQSPILLVCVDTWGGSEEHADEDMSQVEARFDHNTELALSRTTNPVVFQKMKSPSRDALARLLTDGNQNFFDFIYIDGSHLSRDVLTDLVLAFPLLKPGGLLVADDYLWAQTQDNPLHAPKTGIDAFVNVFSPKVAVLPGLPQYQLYMTKTEAS
jgi:predicted O-methyltransferase YrrM